MTLKPYWLLIPILLAGCAGGEDISEPDAGGGHGADSDERIPVLTFDQELEADPAIADVRVILPQPYRNRDWPQSGGTPQNVVQHLALNGSLKRVWRTNVGKGSDILTRLISSPVVYDGVVYTIDTRGLVTAVDASNGRKIWTNQLRMKGEKRALAFGGGVGYADGRLFVSTGYGFLAALDAKSGEEIWRYAGIIPLRGAPSIEDGRVFVQTQDNQILAIDTQRGTLIWTQASLPEDAGLLGAASPAIAGDTVVAAMSSGELMAMRVENGRLAWQDTLSRTRRLTPLASLADIDGNPVISRGRVYAVGHAGSMAAIDMRSGERVWERSIASVHTPWIAGEYLFVLSVDAELVALSLADGRVRWMTRLQRFKNPEDRDTPLSWTGPVLAGDRLIIASSHGYILSVSPYTGEFLGAETLSDGVIAPPIIADGTLYFLTEGADLVAYR
ncbi:MULTISPECIES: PQQ-binding-like beta-propeller repeat protein [unclassified Iodidimonas]|uniref:outer membrane protein assembly factor BamB family protein n=1 Tax=unclassified Iodidimonas TaxID=2626145 RepID=UPI002482420E|nr:MULTISPECIES: PQQ-binding-like beta-propeller repeat protein [unclassified Iodidimonas]